MMNLYVFIILSFIHQCKLQSISGAKVQITETGLNYVASIGMDLLEKEIQNLKIPDTNEVSNIRVTSFVKPTVSIAVNPGQGMTTQISNAQIHVNFDWRYQVGSGWFKLSDSGSGDAKSDSISISVGLGFGKDDTGRPTAHLTSCLASISSFKFSLGNKLYDTLIKLVTKVFDVDIPRKLEGEFCKAFAKLVAESLGHQFSTLETMVKIDDQISLKYGLTENPQFFPQYIETSHEAVFVSSNFQYIYSIPQSMNLAVPSKMVSMAFSENLFNSAGYILQKLQRLDKNETINNEQLTNIFDLPPGPLAIQLKTTTPPTVSINATGLSITASATVSVSASATELIYANVTIHLVGDVYIEDELIKGRIYTLDSNLGAMRVRNEKDLSPVLFNQVLDLLFNKTKPLINKRGAEGFPVPKVKQVTLLEPSIQRLPGFVQVSTNFKYVP